MGMTRFIIDVLGFHWIAFSYWYFHIFTITINGREFSLFHVGRDLNSFYVDVLGIRQFYYMWKDYRQNK